MTNNSPIWLSEDQLAALSTPKTREVFNALRKLGPSSVDQIQDLLGSKSKTIYYQITKLLRVGLVIESGSSKGYRRSKTLYEALMGELQMPEGFQGARYERLAAKGVAATLRSAIRRFRQAAEEAEARPELVDDLSISTVSMKLTDEQVKEFKTRLGKLLKEFESFQSSENRALSLVCVLTPHSSRLIRKSTKAEEFSG